MAGFRMWMLFLISFILFRAKFTVWAPAAVYRGRFETKGSPSLIKNLVE